MNLTRVETGSRKPASSFIDQNKLRLSLETQGRCNDIEDYRKLRALCRDVNIENTHVNSHKVSSAAKTMPSKKRKVTRPKRFDPNEFVLAKKVKRNPKTNDHTVCPVEAGTAADRSPTFSSHRENATESKSYDFGNEATSSEIIKSPDFGDKPINKCTPLTTHKTKNRSSISSTDQHGVRETNMEYPDNHSTDSMSDDLDNMSDKSIKSEEADDQNDVIDEWSIFWSSEVDQSDLNKMDHEQNNGTSNENTNFMSTARDSLPHTTKHLDDLSSEASFNSEHSTEDLEEFSDEFSFTQEHSTQDLEELSNELPIKRKKSNSDLEDVSSELSYETAKKRAYLNSSAKGTPEENIETKNEYPASFTIMLNKSEWKTIKPKKNDAYRKLRSSWTDLFSEKMANIDVPCVLQFFYNRIKRLDSRKFNARYFHGKAKCKFETCTWYTFEIAEKPAKVSKNGVTIKVTRHGEVKHPRHQTKRRQLRGERRELYKQQLQREGASNLHYKLLADLRESQHAGGNHTIPSNKAVLRQAKYEMKKKEYLHTDEWTEVVMTRQILQDLDQDSKSMPGYIQFLSYQPFITISFTERQLQIFRNQKKLGRGVLYLDATGSLVKKQSGSDKPVYYYAAVVKNNKPNEPSMPIAEMFSNEHTTAITSLFLGKLKQELMAFGSSWPIVQPRRIEVDFSWSLINSVLVVCNQENITAYLSRAWEIATEPKKDTKFTKIHLCSAHLIKRVRDRLSHTTSDKGLADFCAFAFALLQNSFELGQAKSIYVSLCTVLGSEYETKSVKDAIAKIEKQIAEQTEERETSVHLCPQEVECDFQQEKSTSTIKALSPFTKFFASMKSNIPPDAGYSLKVKNKYHNKQALTVLESYLHLYPLWSGLLLTNENHNNGKPVTRDTNCCVENWFRIVKQDILNKKQRQRPGPVLRELHKNIRGRSREYQSSMESKILPDLNQVTVESETVRQDHIEMSQEQWRPVTKSKTSKFYTPPKQIPGPTPDAGEDKKPKRGQKRSRLSLRQGGNADFVNSHRIESKTNDSWINSLLQAMKGWLPTPIGESSNKELNQFLKKLTQLTDTSTVNPVELIRELQTSPEFSNMEFGEESNPVRFLHYFLQRMHKADLFQPICIQKELECLLCSTTDSPVPEKVSTLMVNLTAPSIQMCINDYFKPTTPGIQQRCPKCQALTNHHQKRSVLEASDVLVIILKRFTESPRKHLASVTIEKEISLRTMANNTCDYDLQSIQLHHGKSVYGGHYTAASVTSKGMISYDDETVTEKGQDFLQSSEAQTGCYMMFYKRTDTSKKTSQRTGRRGSNRATRPQLLLRQDDMRTLEARSWLNDQVVNAYMATLEDKYPVWCLDTFLLEEIKRTGVGNVSREINTTDMEFLFIPLHQQSHWSLVVVDVKKGTISYLDPLGLVNETNMKTISDYLKQAGLTLVRDKHLEHFKKFPTQKNTYDCGVYILEYARCIAAHQRCTQANMKKGREKIKRSLEEVYPIQLVVTDD
ncbi:uncharacterized protein LOC110450426 [Mizuhopecten yessoensis]|uniref:uncharacterized protein LOC110450426 n=1 Tax=Mizuhopecten yessoensis TaxID=6573 RepID=UPI000B45A94F|nr:uncharacterized protein LOC110450426 [Mizuhopecten yessoensis]XP_021353625.1 uncharacterized protein LOC110450426 [Mizuhopecten yessoensis]XP_021353635.1 uncharacterized protein LOC110450426 [Mizuhopecten yessoensis]